MEKKKILRIALGRTGNFRRAGIVARIAVERYRIEIGAPNHGEEFLGRPSD